MNRRISPERIRQHLEKLRREEENLTERIEQLHSLSIGYPKAKDDLLKAQQLFSFVAAKRESLERRLES